MEEEREIKELRYSVERRFEFLILILVFIIAEWNTFKTLLPSDGIFTNSNGYFGTVISYVFLLYMFFEFSKKGWSKKLLRWISDVLLLLSFCCATFVGLVYINDGLVQGVKLLVLFGSGKSFFKIFRKQKQNT